MSRPHMLCLDASPAHSTSKLLCNKGISTSAGPTGNPPDPPTNPMPSSPYTVHRPPLTTFMMDRGSCRVAELRVRTTSKMVDSGEA